MSTRRRFLSSISIPTWRNWPWSQVLKRCYTTLIPTAASTYLSVHLNPADLYGPFWTLTTLVFALFLSSSLGASIAKYLSTHGTPYDYDFQLLSIAVSLVYAYGLALPIILWVALRYLGVGEWSVVEAIAVWGYGQFVWIPVAVCVSLLSQNGSDVEKYKGPLRHPCAIATLGPCRSRIWLLWLVSGRQHISHLSDSKISFVCLHATSNKKFRLGWSKSHAPANSTPRCHPPRNRHYIQSSFFQLLRGSQNRRGYTSSRYGYWYRKQDYPWFLISSMVC